MTLHTSINDSWIFVNVVFAIISENTLHTFMRYDFIGILF